MPLRQALDRTSARQSSPEIESLKVSLAQQSEVTVAFTRAGFSAFEIKLVSAGERSGRLDESFRQLGDYWKTEQALASEMWKQMAYPIILLHLLPVLAPIQKLVTSSVTEYLITVAGQLLFLYAFAFALFWTVRTLWYSAVGQVVLLRLPLVGRFWRATFAYRWIVALRMEVGAGITFSSALADAWEATGFLSRMTRAEEAREGIIGGQSLAELVGRWRELPEDWVDYFDTAEVSGKIVETLELVEKHALDEWRKAQERLADWMPKLLYVAVILYAAFQVLDMAMSTYGAVGKALDSI